MRIFRLICVTAVVAGFGAAALPVSAAAAVLTGAGSSLIAPIESYWAAAWSGATGNSVSFASVGSGAGEQDAAAGAVDFGASDAPASAYPNSCAGCTWIPSALSAVGIGYNLPGARFSGPHNSGLKLSGRVLAEIFDGRVTSWNDPSIRKLNRGVKLPRLPIRVFFRSDGSGDSYALSDFLAKVAPGIAARFGGPSIAPSFPVGTGENGNAAVATAIRATKGAIGYLSASSLLTGRIATAYVENAHGYFAPPGLWNVAAAASGAVNIADPDITNPPGRYAYPISTFSNIVVPAHPAQPSLLQSFVGYALSTGRSVGEAIGFVPIPASVQKADEALLGDL